MHQRSLLALFILALTCSARAATLRVPSEFPKIQEAVDAAENGDTVLIGDGVHSGPGNRDIDLRGKGIIVTSENGPDVTIIDCQGKGQGFFFASGETRDSVVSGVTIRNGVGLFGGAVQCQSSSPTLEDCIFVANSATDGGGLHCDLGSAPLLKNCAFSGNDSQSRGGGVTCFAGSAVRLISCRIAGNVAPTGAGLACVGEGSAAAFRNCRIEGNSREGVYCASEASPLIEGCTISSNVGGGIACVTLASPTITNCLVLGNLGSAILSAGNSSPLVTHGTITGNRSELEDVLRCDFDSVAVFSSCIVWGNTGSLPSPAENSLEFRFSTVETDGPWPGPENTDGDPRFVSPAVLDFGRSTTENVGGVEFELPAFVVNPGDYHLQPGSPAIDTGSPTDAPLTDLEGDGRPCGGGVDMGALENGGCPAPALEVQPDTVEIGHWERELLSVTLLDGEGNGVAGRALDFRSADPSRAWFPFPRAYTNRDGVAYNVIDGDLFGEPDLSTSFTVSTPGIESGPVPVRGGLVIADGPIDFTAPALERFQGSEQRLVGEACGFVFPEDVGLPVAAWSIDPTVAEIGDGAVSAFLPEVFCERMEFNVTAHKAGKAVFIIGTVDFSIYESTVTFQPGFRRGDSNADGRLDLSDPVNTLDSLFTGGGSVTCADSADSNDDGSLDVSDAIHSLTYLFLGGPPPPDPGPQSCGVDPTDDGLDCVSSPGCE